MKLGMGLSVREVALRTMKSAIEICDVEEFEEQLELFKDRGLKLTLEEVHFLKKLIDEGHPMEQEWFTEVLENHY